MPDPDLKFALADRISDAIIDKINEERLRPGFDPVVALAGVLLGLKGYLRTAPKDRPEEVEMVEATATLCLFAIKRWRADRDAV